VVIDKVHLVITGAHDVLVRGAACPAACGVKAALVRRVVAPPGRAGGDRLKRPVRARKRTGSYLAAISKSSHSFLQRALSTLWSLVGMKWPGQNGSMTSEPATYPRYRFPGEIDRGTIGESGRLALIRRLLIGSGNAGVPIRGFARAFVRVR
jgi:hypothetical protein